MRVKLHKSETNDQCKKGDQLQSWQLNWFLQSKLQLRTRLNKSELEADLDFDMFLPPFSFKWNDAFCPKWCHFIHCSLTKKTWNGVILNGTMSLLLSSLLLSLDAWSRGRRRFFFPLFSIVFSLKKMLAKDPYLPKAFHVSKKREEMCPSGSGGAVAQWLPRPLSPLFFAYKYRGDKGEKRGRVEIN